MQIRAVMAALALASALAGCGGGGGSSSGGDSSASAVSSGGVSITAAGPADPVASGSAAQVDVTVANSSNVDASNLVVAPNLASGLTLLSFTCGATTGASCPAAGSTGNFSVASLPAHGSLTLHLMLGSAAGTSASLSVAPTVTVGSGGNGGTPANNAASVVLHVYSADLSVSGAGPSAPVAAGAQASYTMTVSNAGPDDAHDVSLANTLDAYQTLGTMTCTASGGANCPATLGSSMTVPLLPKGGSLSFTVPGLVAAGTSTSISNIMTATAPGDPVGGNNSATVSVTTYIPAITGKNSIKLQSDAGDYIGGGQSYAYDSSNALITVTATGAYLSVQVSGDQSWTGSFQLPSGQSQLQPGTYANLTRYPFENLAVGGMDWSGQGRGCNTEQSTLVINSVNYVAGQLTGIDLSFVQHCEGAAPALHGQLHWNAADTTSPPGPVTPAPAGLWMPPSGATPATGSYVYLSSDAGDFVGAGASYLYTKASSVLSVSANGGRASISVTGDQNWTGNFQAMTNLAQLTPGYYSGLQRYGFANPAKGGLDWSGEGRGCNTSSSWVVIDSISFVNGSLATLDMRFEQHCEGAAPALHGKIHWDANDTTAAPGPVNPPPSTLWQPPSGATPASGNYVYLASDGGDYIGAGQTYLYSGSTATATFSASGNHLNVSVGGWSGDFQGMTSLALLQPGYYANLERYPFSNPVKGGLNWSGQGRGCNTLSGWFVIDSISYSGSTVSALDLRFEQHCEGAVPALRGKIHWVVGAGLPGIG